MYHYLSSQLNLDSLMGMSGPRCGSYCTGTNREVVQYCHNLSAYPAGMYSLRLFASVLLIDGLVAQQSCTLTRFMHVKDLPSGAGKTSPQPFHAEING